MKAVIMAGGEGTRLRPLTSNCPKPMLPLANRPMMEHIVDLLKAHGIDEIVVTVAYLANQIIEAFMHSRHIDEVAAELAVSRRSAFRLRDQLKAILAEFL